MKIVITTTQVPFVTGGAEFHALNLKNALIQKGHEAEIVTMPFIDTPVHMIENHIIAARLMDINNSWGGNADLCIGLKFPAYYMPHNNKVLWILHQHRAAYDLYGTEFSNIQADESGKEIRKIITNADNKYINEAKRVYANSKNVGNRLKKYNGIESTPLYHPCPDMDSFYCENYEDYILMPSRINSTKRQKMALEAMVNVKSNIKLYVVGKADNDYEMNEILKIYDKYRLKDRVRFFNFVSQEEKLKLYANAKAVIFIPYDEDYGYITLEAMASNKLVITAKDSGGPLEFVQEDYNGMIVDPDPKEIAYCIDEIARSKNMPLEYGKNAKRTLVEMNINWDNVVKELTR